MAWREEMPSIQIFINYKLLILSRLGCNATWWFRKNDRMLWTVLNSLENMQHSIKMPNIATMFKLIICISWLRSIFFILSLPVHFILSFKVRMLRSNFNWNFTIDFSCELNLLMSILHRKGLHTYTQGLIHTINA